MPLVAVVLVTYYGAGRLSRPHESRHPQRPYLRREWCEQALREPVRREFQPNGRVRHWAYIHELGRFLRVVTLEDGETVHNAFPDRDFTENG